MSWRAQTLRGTRGARPLAACVGLLLTLASAHGSAFTYQPHGTLKPGSGTGQKSTKDYVPGMRFPMLKAPAYANSQVYMNGGSQGGGGGQCDKVNYSYPWWDNYCEKRSWTMPLCPSGKGHQGQDIRPGSCKFNTHWVVATEAGTITSIGTYVVYEKSVTGVTHRYMHMKMNALAVKVGQKVAKGQKLGLVDNDFGGTPTSLHLHYDRRMYVSGVGTVYVPTYASLVNSYKVLIGGGCDATACSAKSGCGSWGACGGFTSVCDTTGSRKRSCTTYACVGGSCKATSKTETQACSRVTDGKAVSGWSGWSTCAPQGGVCTVTGSQKRTRSVCQGGSPKTQSATQACAVKSDGKVVQGWSAWSACGGFESTCDEGGTRSRSRSVCKAGAAVPQTAKEPCTESKDGVAVSAWGPWGPCAGFAGPCDGQGVRKRSRLVCAAGASKPEVATQPCQVDREGVALTPWGPWTACVPDSKPCAPSGTRRRTRQVCAAGAPKVDAQLESCVPACAGGLGGDASSDAGGVVSGDARGADGDVVAGLAPRSPSGGCSAAFARGGVIRGTATAAGGARRSGSGPGPWWILVATVGVVWATRRVT